MTEKEKNDPFPFVCNPMMPKCPSHSMLTHRGCWTSGRMHAIYRKKGHISNIVLTIRMNTWTSHAIAVGNLAMSTHCAKIIFSNTTVRAVKPMVNISQCSTRGRSPNRKSNNKNIWKWLHSPKVNICCYRNSSERTFLLMGGKKYWLVKWSFINKE